MSEFVCKHGNGSRCGECAVTQLGASSKYDDQKICRYCNTLNHYLNVGCVRCGKSFGLASGSTAADMVNHPPHYTSHPSGVECIQVAEHYPFCIGSAIKYLWRAGLKGDAIEDLKKAVWYINREIAKRQQPNNQ